VKNVRNEYFLTVGKNHSIMKYISIILLLSLFISFQGCCTFSGYDHKGEVSDHFDGEKFINKRFRDVSFWDIIVWNATKERSVWHSINKNKYKDIPAEMVSDGKLFITYINHATVLIQYDGINVLTDPVWSYRISPVSFIGPERKRKPGVKFEDLPPIDLVLISHNHYDHMDIPTLRKLKENFEPFFIVPLGNKKLLDEYGITNSIEMDWWEEHLFNGEHLITMVPAEHFSMRGFCDRNTTLWAGYMLDTRKGNVLYAADTGFSSHFQEIKDRFGNIIFAMLPIAPIEPRWLMEAVHMSPEEAVKTHILLGSKQSMGIHFGTFQQADDAQDLAIDLLKQAMIKHNVSPKDFKLLPHGMLYEVD
jgi:L-ascorbate metabolism protein UlaG (beta-lactamase superfamily)